MARALKSSPWAAAGGKRSEISPKTNGSQGEGEVDEAGGGGEGEDAPEGLHTLRRGGCGDAPARAEDEGPVVLHNPISCYTCEAGFDNTRVGWCVCVWGHRPCDFNVCPRKEKTTPENAHNTPCVRWNLRSPRACAGPRRAFHSPPYTRVLVYLSVQWCCAYTRTGDFFSSITRLPGFASLRGEKVARPGIVKP